MAIIAKNILVRGASSPTITEDKITSPVNPDKEQQYVQRQTKQEDISEDSHYLKKVDGELIRHINKKSLYLTDMLEIES